MTNTPTPEGVGYKTLSSQGVTLQQLHAFVALATMHTNSPSDPALTNTMLAFAAEHFMPLVYIFECRGLFRVLTDAVNEHPYGPSIVAILQYDHDDYRWLQPQTLRCLAAHLFPAPEGPHPRQAVRLTADEAKSRRTIDELPERVLRDLFHLVMTDDHNDHPRLQPQTLRRLGAHLFPAPEGPHPRQAVMLIEAYSRRTIDELPERVVRDLLHLVLTDLGGFL